MGLLKNPGMAANFANPPRRTNPPEAGSFFTVLLDFSIVFLFAQLAWFAAIDFFNSLNVPFFDRAWTMRAFPNASAGPCKTTAGESAAFGGASAIAAGTA